MYLDSFSLGVGSSFYVTPVIVTLIGLLTWSKSRPNNKFKCICQQPSDKPWRWSDAANARPS